jgi:hypothetical protein
MSYDDQEENKEVFSPAQENGPIDTDVQSQLQKIQEHLGFLEKKLDILLRQSRPSGGSSFTPNQGGGGGHYKSDFRGGGPRNRGPRAPHQRDQRDRFNPRESRGGFEQKDRGQFGGEQRGPSNWKGNRSNKPFHKKSKGSNF